MDEVMLLLLLVFTSVVAAGQLCPQYYYYDPVAIQCFPCIEACTADNEAFQKLCQQQCTEHTTDGTIRVTVLHTPGGGVSHGHTIEWILVAVIATICMLVLVGILAAVVYRNKWYKRDSHRRTDAELEEQVAMATAEPDEYMRALGTTSNQTSIFVPSTPVIPGGAHIVYMVAENPAMENTFDTQMGATSGHESLLVVEESDSSASHLQQRQNPVHNGEPVMQEPQRPDSPDGMQTSLKMVEEGVVGGATLVAPVASLTTLEFGTNSGRGICDVGRPLKREVLSKEESGFVSSDAEFEKVME